MGNILQMPTTSQTKNVSNSHRLKFLHRKPNLKDNTENLNQIVKEYKQRKTHTEKQHTENEGHH